MPNSESAPLIQDSIVKEQESSELDDSSSSKSKSRCATIMVIITLWSACIVQSLHVSIRYGFLMVSFEKRGIPGHTYGLVESSIIFGYIVMFLSGMAKYTMTRFNAKYIFMVTSVIYMCTSVTTGTIYLHRNKTAVIIVSACARVIQGTMSYMTCMMTTDYTKAHFSEHFDAMNGFVTMSYFTGHGIAETLGCLLYGKFGYQAPFMFTTGFTLLSLCLVACFIPKSENYVAGEKNVVYTSTQQKRVSPMVFLPLLAAMLINADYGFVQVSVVPYLQDVFGKSEDFGGIVLIFISLGAGVGALTCGLCLQKRVLHTYTQMAIGALMVTLGLFVTFPHRLSEVWHDAAYLAIPGVFMAAFGDPCITIATLRAMLDMQEKCRGTVSPNQFSLISGFWLMGYCGCFFSGALIAGVMKDSLTYTDSALILGCVGWFCVALCIVLRIVTVRMRSYDEKCEEKGELKPLLEEY